MFALYIDVVIPLFFMHILFRISLLLCFFALMACKGKPVPEPSYLFNQGNALGTTYSIKYEHPEGTDLSAEIVALLDEFENSMSIYRPQSVISKINSNLPGAMPDAHFLKLFAVARGIWAETDGLYDITVAPLVNAWGFGFSTKADVPSEQIDSLLAFVGMDKVSIQEGRVVKADPRIMFDCNSIAKGYAVDLVASYLQSLNIDNFLVEIGGEINARGVNPSRKTWSVAIDKPFEGNQLPGVYRQAVLALRDRSLATSGNYRRYYEENGVKYAHSINPLTGFPVRDTLLSVTIVASDCTTADAWATACMVSGLQKSISLLEKHPNLDAYLVYSDREGKYRSYSTKGIKENILAEAAE